MFLEANIMANRIALIVFSILSALLSGPVAAQLVNSRVHNLAPDPGAAVPPGQDPGHNTHQESVIFGCLGIIVVLAVLSTLILWFVVERNKSDIRRLDKIIPEIAERMRKEMITANGELMSGTLTASHEFETEFLTNEDVQLTSYRQREEVQDASGAEASAPPVEAPEEAPLVTEAIVIATDEAVEAANNDDGEATRRDNEENADQIDISTRERRRDCHNRHSFPVHYRERHDHERRSHERHSRDRRSHDHHYERYYERHPERRQERPHDSHHELDQERPKKRHRDIHPELRHSTPDSNYINFGATPDVTLETRPPPPSYVHAYDNPGMSLRDEREYRRVPRRSAPRTAPKPDHTASRPVSAYVTSGNEYREENARPISVIGIIDDGNEERWPSRYGYNSHGRKYRSLLYESHV